MPSSSALTASERRAASSLAALFAFRMLGMFMILPVFTLYGPAYAGYSSALAGLAIGAYGLTQALLQVPYGVLSDRYGRKPLILIGLLVFCAGSVLAALADSIHGVIAGRALQGAGAIPAVVLAMAADLSREEVRTKIMAFIGIAIGASFGLAQILGPVLAPKFGLSGLFWLTAVMAVVGMALIVFVVPTPVQLSHERSVNAQGLHIVLRDGQLLRLDFGIFALHLIMTATLMTVPLMLQAGGLPAVRHSWVYLAAMVLAILALGPLMHQARRGRQRGVLLGVIALLVVAELGFALAGGADWHALAVLLLLFYIGFNYLEACLPALISRRAPAASKGAAMGVYATAQFLGAALGGALGGRLYQSFGVTGVFGLGAFVAVLWLLSSLGLKPQSELASHRLAVDRLTPADAETLLGRLLELPGVRTATLLDGAIYLQVEAAEFDQEALAGLTSLG